MTGQCSWLSITHRRQHSHQGGCTLQLACQWTVRTSQWMADRQWNKQHCVLQPHLLTSVMTVTGTFWHQACLGLHLAGVTVFCSGWLTPELACQLVHCSASNQCGWPSCGHLAHTLVGQQQQQQQQQLSVSTHMLAGKDITVCKLPAPTFHLAGSVIQEFSIPKSLIARFLNVPWVVNTWTAALDFIAKSLSS